MLTLPKSEIVKREVKISRTLEYQKTHTLIPETTWYLLTNRGV